MEKSCSVMFALAAVVLHQPDGGYVGFLDVLPLNQWRVIWRPFFNIQSV
jgi:hypothetical protein